MVRGSCPVCHPSWVVSLVLQNLVGAQWSSSGHTTCVFLFLNALFALASASTRRFGYSMLCLSVALFPGAGVRLVLCFRQGFAAKTQAPPLLLGLWVSLYRPNQRGQSHGRLLYPVQAVRCSWSTWVVHRQRCEPFMLPQVVACRRDRRSRSPSGSGCRCHWGAGSRSRNSLFCVP